MSCYLYDLPVVMCIAVPVGHLVVLFAVMIRARVHPNDQEFIPSILFLELSLQTVPVTVPVTVFMTALRSSIMISYFGVFMSSCFVFCVFAGLDVCELFSLRFGLSFTSFFYSN